MRQNKRYLFRSARLGFRNWEQADIAALCEINRDPVVMEFFPDVATREQTVAFADRMKRQYASRGFCYFAVDKLEDGSFVGFTGLSEQTYEADFTPCVDIGWRIKRSEWGQGLATEGALRCLEYAFGELGMERVYAVAPAVNTRSERVMQKIGMAKLYAFEHPLLLDDARLGTCVLYGIERG